MNAADKEYQLGVAMMKASTPNEKARALARITMGGAAGRLLLEMSFDAEEARHG